MTIGERIKNLRQEEKQASFGDRFGKNRDTIRRYEANKNPPDANFLAALCLEYKVNPTWLLFGEGPMHTDEASGPIAINEEEVGKEYVRVPRYEVAASAGGGAFVESSEQIVDYLSFRSEWVRNALGVSVKDLSLINVIGDSMEPTLSDGDVVLLDMTFRGVQDSAIYVLQLNGTLLVKRIQHKLNGSLEVISDNQRYKTETVAGDEANQLKIIGRVVWAGRKM